MSGEEQIFAKLPNSARDLLYLQSIAIVDSRRVGPDSRSLTIVLTSISNPHEDDNQGAEQILDRLSRHFLFNLN
jgi:hypothetical protein